MCVFSKDLGVVSKMLFHRLVIPVTHTQESVVSGYTPQLHIKLEAVF